MISVKRPDVELYKSASRREPVYSEMNIAESESKKTHYSKIPTHKDFLKKINPCNSNSTNESSGFALMKLLRNSDVNFSPEQLLNMKEMHSIAKIKTPPKDVFNIVCDNIIEKMLQHETLDIISLRDNLYDILLYCLDVTECLWYILYYFVENEIFVDETGKMMSEIMNKINVFLKYYNNNYRPIYHLESIFIYLIIQINRYPNEPKNCV